MPQSREEAIQQDIQDLHGLGYAQELLRSMGGFSNFAISFSIISILTGAVILYNYGLDARRAGCGRPRLAAGHDLHADDRGHHGRDRLGLPDRRRPVLLGQQAAEQGLGLVDRLAQPRRPDLDRRRASTTRPRSTSSATILNPLFGDFDPKAETLGVQNAIWSPAS